MMTYQLVRLYAKLYGLVKGRLGVNLPGLGVALRQIKEDRAINVMGRVIFFNHKIGAAYGLHIAGLWNEPETHGFLDAVIGGVEGPIAFIDVGANVGEFVIDVARHKKVEELLAVEPLADCCEAIARSLELNGREKYAIWQKLVGEKAGMVSFGASKSIGGSSLHSMESRVATEQTEMTTLDALAGSIQSRNVIVLVDVEGYEPNVLKGGRTLIERRRPLIIFEYNELSRRHYHIDEIKCLLGEGYSLRRLRADGRLDRDVARAWNCVAIPVGSTFDRCARALFV